MTNAVRGVRGNELGARSTRGGSPEEEQRGSREASARRERERGARASAAIRAPGGRGDRRFQPITYVVARFSCSNRVVVTDALSRVFFPPRASHSTQRFAPPPLRKPLLPRGALGSARRVRPPASGAMGAELAFVVLQGAVKFLDGLFWVFGKGVLSILAYVVASVARALLAAMDAPPPRGGPSSGGGGPSSPNDAKIGAPRAAPLDPDLIPVSPRVRLSSRGDAKKMRDKHAAHCAWRHKYDVANILQTPKPVFDVVKAYYPHAFHGRTKGRHAVQLERPGRFGDLLAAVRRIPGHADDPADAVAAHVSFVLTHAFDKIDPRPLPNGRVLRVVDMSRLDASDTSFEAFAFLRVMAGVSSAAFPERVHRVVIVNPPSVFGLMWSAFSPLISKGTLARIRICKTPEETFEALEEDLDASDIPREFGGTCECAAPRGYARRARARGALGMDGGDDTPLDRCGPCWKYDEHERRLRARVDELNGRVPRRGGRGARGEEDATQ